MTDYINYKYNKYFFKQQKNYINFDKEIFEKKNIFKILTIISFTEKKYFLYFFYFFLQKSPTPP